jgi:hypothetical protein
VGEEVGGGAMFSPKPDFFFSHMIKQKSDYFCGHEKSLPNISSNFNQV